MYKKKKNFINEKKTLLMYKKKINFAQCYSDYNKENSGAKLTDI